MIEMIGDIHVNTHKRNNMYVQRIEIFIQMRKFTDLAMKQ